MRHFRAYLILICAAAVLLLASCGKRYTAKGLVKDYVKAYAVNPDKIDITSFSDLDSTKVISDSLLQVMRETAKKMRSSSLTSCSRQSERTPPYSSSACASNYQMTPSNSRAPSILTAI